MEFVKTVAVFDTETTGLVKPKECDLDKQPFITEIYIYKMGLDKSDEWHFLGEFEQMFKVPVPLSADITRITGLVDADLADKPTFGACSKELSKFMVGVDELVAHNLAFDRNMLVNDLHRCGRVLNFPWPPVHTCTVEKTMQIEQRRMSLTNLHLHLFGEEFPNAHRAKSDVIPLVRVYKELHKRGII